MNADNEVDEEVQHLDSLIYKSLLQVIVSSEVKLTNDSIFIVKSKEQMHMQKREKGSITGEQKVKSLNGS